jgi:hypothetical protein
VSPVRAAALRLEMAEGRVQAIRQGGVDTSGLDEALFDLESQRNAFRLALGDATGLDPGSVARLLAL